LYYSFCDYQILKSLYARTPCEKPAPQHLGDTSAKKPKTQPLDTDFKMAPSSTSKKKAKVHLPVAPGKQVKVLLPESAKEKSKVPDAVSKGLAAQVEEAVASIVALQMVNEMESESIEPKLTGLSFWYV
jgi:hypothetical protein